jgi:hypothetical protein
MFFKDIVQYYSLLMFLSDNVCINKKLVFLTFNPYFYLDLLLYSV